MQHPERRVAVPFIDPIACEPLRVWSRLEPRSRKPDFDEALRAETHDPLWFLTRQWQFGEFKGEDAGSAVKARVQASTARIDKYAAKSEDRTAGGLEQWKNAVPYDDGLPLETEVEREPLWIEGADAH